MGKCLGIIHVWHVRISVSEFPFDGKCDSTFGDCLDLHVAFLRKLRVVVENFCRWCKWWTLLCNLRGLLLGVPHGYIGDWFRHDLFGVSIHVCNTLFDHGRGYRLCFWVLICGRYLLWNQVRLKRIKQQRNSLIYLK